MNEATKQQVDTSSAEFKEGVEAGLSSTADTTEDTKNWKAGNELGHELKDEGEKKEPVFENLFKEPTPPLFMRNTAEGDRGNAQDEKDETEE